MLFLRKKSIDPFELRYQAIVYLTRRNTKALERYLNQPPEKRQWGLKPDGSEITRIDYAIGLRSFTYISKHFEHDSIYSEEMPMLKPSAEWEFGEDPVDVTTDARRYDKDKPENHQWASYMASFTRDRKPEIIGLGIPIRNEMYYGSVKHGLYLNETPFTPPFKDSSLIIGLNELEYADFLKKLTGHHTAYLASVIAWLTAQKAAGGGIIHNKRPYEVNCILAIAQINGAMITDEDGNEYRSGTKARYAIWSYPHLNHEKILKQFREKNHLN